MSETRTPYRSQTPEDILNSAEDVKARTEREYHMNQLRALQQQAQAIRDQYAGIMRQVRGLRRYLGMEE